jgi:uncharacterized coiled-coil protein SlyX
MMQQQVETRLQELREEYASGQRVLAELQNKQAEVQQTLLRISGAIQVLEELLSRAEEPSPETPPASD